MLQIFDNLEINDEKDWSIKISSAIEESYKYRPYQKNVDSLKSILSLNTARNIASSIEKNTIVSYQNELEEYNYSDLAMQHTAHLTASDKYGNVVSLTQTLGPNMGSRVATKGLGFLYNVTMGPYLGGYLGEDKPGDRASSHISPTLFTSLAVLVHGIIFILISGFVYRDWDMISIASQANIGGGTSAIALAEAFDRKDLILPAILVGSLGNALGTYLGFLVIYIL